MQGSIPHFQYQSQDQIKTKLSIVPLRQQILLTTTRTLKPSLDAIQRSQRAGPSISATTLRLPFLIRLSMVQSSLKLCSFLRHSVDC